MADVTPRGAAPAPTRTSIVSWVLYSFANHFFGLNIASLYFSIWVVNVMHARDADYALANSVSMGIIFLGSPVLGALSDQASRRMPFLVLSTLVCVLFTGALGIHGLWWSLTAFAIANIGYQAGLQFSDGMLSDVSTHENQGRIGGWGMAIGYLGALAAIILGRVLLAGAEALPQEGQTLLYIRLFRASAAAFLVFAIPCFLFVRERDRPGRTFSAAAIPAAFREVVATLRRSRDYRGLLPFLIARVFYTDAVNTVIAFMGIYVSNEVGFTATQSSLVILVAIVVSIPAALGWGALVDRIGPRRTLEIVLGLWGVTFVWIVAVGYFHLPGATFWPAAALAGVCLGGTGAAERPLMLRLTPPARLGEFFGLYGMVGRFSAIIGPFCWGLVTDYLHLGRPAAVASLLGFVALGWFLLRPVTDEHRAWPAHEA